MVDAVGRSVKQAPRQVCLFQCSGRECRGTRPLTRFASRTDPGSSPGQALSRKSGRGGIGGLMTDQLAGGCACGAVRYRLGSAPMFVHCCHCRDCQRQTGSAFVLNALIEADRVEVQSGDPQPFAMPTDSGQPHHIFRCPACGTAVWSEYGGRKVLRFVRVGTLDDPTALTPDVHIYVRSKLPWVALPEGVPAFEAYYDSKKLWPAESLERRRAMFG